MSSPAVLFFGDGCGIKSRNEIKLFMDLPAQIVFAYLIGRKDYLVSRDCLCDIVWNDLGFSAARKQLRGTIRRINQCLTMIELNDKIKIVSNKEFLTLRVDDDLFVDTYKIMELCACRERADTCDGEKMLFEELLQTVSLYKTWVHVERRQGMDFQPTAGV